MKRRDVLKGLAALAAVGPAVAKAAEAAPAAENATLRERFFEAAWARRVEEAGADVFRHHAYALALGRDSAVRFSTGTTEQLAAPRSEDVSDG